MKKRLIAVLTAGLMLFGGVAWAENEATFDFGTGVLNIPKVAVGSDYFNVNMQQQGQGLDFSVSGAVASTSSSTANIAIYNAATGALNIPTVVVGAASYTVDMAQGQGLNFSVTYAAVIPPVQVNPQDCNGVQGGSAILDNCNVCVGGNTGRPSGSTSPSTEYVEYDMWDYVVSKTSIIKNIDAYDTDSNYNLIGGSYLNAGQLAETIMSLDTVKYEEIVNGTVEDTEILIVSSYNIEVVGGNLLNRYRTLNSSFGNCIIENHYENYSPISGYNYEDVIQIKCGVYSMFYAKGIGKVVGQNHNSWDNGQNTTHYYSVGVANLCL